jgi:hypothetical protein
MYLAQFDNIVNVALNSSSSLACADSINFLKPR